MGRTFISTAVRELVAQKLRTHPEIIATGAAVVTRARGQLESELRRIIASLVLSIVVTPCEIRKVNPNTSPPLIEELGVIVTVTESKLNTGLEGEELAELILVLLHGMPLPELGPAVELYADADGTRCTESPDKLALTIVSFRCTGLPAQLP